MYLTLPKRVLNSPLVAYANFSDGSFINLIKISKPYANGNSYAVQENTKCVFCSNGMFKTYDQALEKFNLMIKNNLACNSDLELKDFNFLNT